MVRSEVREAERGEAGRVSHGYGLRAYMRSVLDNESRARQDYRAAVQGLRHRRSVLRAMRRAAGAGLVPSEDVAAFRREVLAAEKVRKQARVELKQARLDAEVTR